MSTFFLSYFNLFNFLKMTSEQLFHQSKIPSILIEYLIFQRTLIHSYMKKISLSKARIFIFKITFKLSIMVHSCNRSNRKNEEEGSWVRGYLSYRARPRLQQYKQKPLNSFMVIILLQNFKVITQFWQCAVFASCIGIHKPNFSENALSTNIE